MSDSSTHRLSHLLGGSIILFIGLTVQLGFGFAAKLLIARHLGKVDYGSVSIGITLMTSVSIIVLLGFDTGIGRYLPRQTNQSDSRGVLVSSFGTVMPIAILAGAAVVMNAGVMATALFGQPSISPIIRVFGIAIPLMVFLRLTVGTIRGRQESTPRVVLQNLLLPLIRFGLIAVSIVAGLGAFGVAFAYVGAYVIVGIGAIHYLYTRTRLFEFGRVDAKPMRRELLAFSAPLMVVSTMNMIHSNLDVFIVGYFRSTGAVGVYTVAYPIATLLTVVLSSFGFLFMPNISTLFDDDEYGEARRLYQLVSKWIFLLTLPAFLIIATYPEMVIRYTFGTEYLDGALVLTVLSIGFFTHAVAGPSGNALTATGQTQLIMFDNTAVAFINLGLNLLLVPRYSILGAAVATTVGYGLMNVLYIYQLHQNVGVHPFRRATFVPASLAVVAWLLLNGIASSIMQITILSLVGVFGLFLLLYLLILPISGGIEQEELTLAAAVNQRVRVNLSPILSAVRFLAKLRT